MKYRYPAILAVLVILFALAVAGCTTSGNTGVSVTPTPAGATATATAAAPASSVSQIADLTNVHWYEYQITSAGSTVTIKWDTNVNYNGQNADMTTVTMNDPRTGTSGTEVMYLDHATHKQFLGGNITEMKNGQVAYQTNLPSTSNAPPIPLDLTNTSYSGASTLTNEGSDSVTVPAGTYTATKYMLTQTNGNPATVWMAANVPIFLKWEGNTSSGVTTDMELMGWG